MSLVARAKHLKDLTYPAHSKNWCSARCIFNLSKWTAITWSLTLTRCTRRTYCRWVKIDTWQPSWWNTSQRIRWSSVPMVSVRRLLPIGEAFYCHKDEDGRTRQCIMFASWYFSLNFAACVASPCDSLSSSIFLGRLYALSSLLCFFHRPDIFVSDFVCYCCLWVWPCRKLLSRFGFLIGMAYYHNSYRPGTYSGHAAVYGYGICCI